MLRGSRRHLGEPFDLPIGLLLGLLGQSCFIDFLAKDLGALLPFFALPEFPTDGFQLLTQHVITLGLAHLVLNFFLDLGLDLEFLALLRQLTKD